MDSLSKILCHLAFLRDFNDDRFRLAALGIVLCTFLLIAFFAPLVNLTAACVFGIIIYVLKDRGDTKRCALELEKSIEKARISCMEELKEKEGQGTLWRKEQ